MSTLSPAQSSWIVDNIRSITHEEDDDENDNTLILDTSQRNQRVGGKRKSTANEDEEIEQTRTFPLKNSGGDGSTSMLISPPHITFTSASDASPSYERLKRSTFTEEMLLADEFVPASAMYSSSQFDYELDPYNMNEAGTIDDNTLMSYKAFKMLEQQNQLNKKAKSGDHQYEQPENLEYMLSPSQYDQMMNNSFNSRSLSASTSTSSISSSKSISPSFLESKSQYCYESSGWPSSSRLGMPSSLSTSSVAAAASASSISRSNTFSAPSSDDYLWKNNNEYDSTSFHYNKPYLPSESDSSAYNAPSPTFRSKSMEYLHQQQNRQQQPQQKAAYGSKFQQSNSQNWDPKASSKYNSVENNSYASKFNNRNRFHDKLDSAASPPAQQNQSQIANNNDEDGLFTLHVKNLDYKISADEWTRILTENFRKHCNIISLNVVTNTDKSLLGIVKLKSLEESRLAFSFLNHKKIGYKRLNVVVPYATSNNLPRSRVIALIQSLREVNDMALTQFIELYEQKYGQPITISEIFKMKDIIQVTSCKNGLGRRIIFLPASSKSIEGNMHDLLSTPYCSLHSSFSMNTKESTPTWLPNVIVSLRTFKSAVHKLLNDHGGQMPLMSFMDCYKCCICNEQSKSASASNSSSSASSSHYYRGGSHRHNHHHGSNSSPEQQKMSLYQFKIDNENGLPLEHLITCAQDVQIQNSPDSHFKQLQWENDKTKSLSLQSRSSNNNSASSSCSQNDQSGELTRNDLSSQDYTFESLEESSQNKLNEFVHEMIELFKSVPRCTISLSKFNNEYHKKFGRQCRVADYGFNKMNELIEAIPHILQLIEGEFERKITLTHRIQIKRFSNDLIKVLKAHSAKQMFADEYPLAYEKQFGKSFDIRDYGVCFLEDMLAELPDSTIFRQEIGGRTFMQIPKIVQKDEERLCTQRLRHGIVDILRHKPRFYTQFNKLIPNYHHHFGHQIKLCNYGFTKLIELMEAMPETVHIITLSGLQFVQLQREIMLDIICENILKYIEDICNNNSSAINENGGGQLQTSIRKLEEILNSKYEKIHYEDFQCENFAQLFLILPFGRNFTHVSLALSGGGQQKTQLSDDDHSIASSWTVDTEWILQVEPMNERDLKRLCKLVLRAIVNQHESVVLQHIQNKNSRFSLNDLFNIVLSNSNDINYATNLNRRSLNYVTKALNDFFVFEEKTNNLTALSGMYFLAKQICALFKKANVFDMTGHELEALYKQTFSTNEFPHKQLGHVDPNSLITQGLALIVTIKKFTEKRVCLNKEFWPRSIGESTPTIGNNSSTPPKSPEESSNRIPSTPLSVHGMNNPSSINLLDLLNRSSSIN